MRRAFLDGFLVKIFSLKDNAQVYSALAASVWDVRNQSDLDIYTDFQRRLSSTGEGVLNKLLDLRRGVAQLRHQRKELVRETVALVARLGRLHALDDYASVGDHGKLVLCLRDALPSLRSGRTWILHDREPQSVEEMLERNSEGSVGQYVRLDYGRVKVGFNRLEDNCVDLVTMNQGLHHLPLEQVRFFLEQVRNDRSSHSRCPVHFLAQPSVPSPF